MSITTVHRRGFHRVQLPIGQMYHVAVDTQFPYYFYTNVQDGPNMRGPSIARPRATWSAQTAVAALARPLT